MTLLVISPDYASHLLPLATIASAWRERGERVVVATGPATSAIVQSSGFERIHLQLGRGSNPGVIRAEQQPRGEDVALRGFFDATRRGAIDTLTFQATARLSDLLWNPVETARRVQTIVDEVKPDQIIVDHLAFGARLGLIAGGIAHADVVLGHPSALPVGHELYGLPPAWPAAITPTPEALDELGSLCERVRDSFTAEWNAALAALEPTVRPSDDAFAEHGELLLLNYPHELHEPARTSFLPPHTFLGSTARREDVDPQVGEWLARSSEPFVYVSFGSFLSVRSDVLARVVEALRAMGVRAAIATGSSDPTAIGEISDGWIVREYLPQVELLRQAAAAVTHGGNNSVTEAMTFGVPLLVLPFSTDQFAGAAAIEAAGVGIALDPNATTAGDVTAALNRLLARDIRGSALLESISRSLTDVPGPTRALETITAGARAAY